MLLKEFLQEYMPLSKGAVKIPISPIIDNYKKRYQELIKRENFKHDVYKSTSGSIIIHVKVPSETVSNFYYDVLIELETYNTNSIDNCDVRFFSNCPSFVYSYAYVFYHLDPDGDNHKRKKTGLLIPNLTRKIPRDRLLMPGTEDKLPDEVLANAPVLRNPRMLTIPDKSIYFSIFYLQSLNFAEINHTKRIRTDIQIISAVEDFDTLMLKRKHQVDKTKSDKSRARKDDEKKIKQVERKLKASNHLIKPTKPVSAVSPVKSKSVHKISKK